MFVKELINELLKINTRYFERKNWVKINGQTIQLLFTRITWICVLSHEEKCSSPLDQ